MGNSSVIGCIAVCNLCRFYLPVILCGMVCYVQLSESDSQDRRSASAVSVSTVASSSSPSPAGSSAELSQVQSTTPQPTVPSVSPQPGLETVDSKGASPAPENKESTELVSFRLYPVRAFVA